MRDTGWRTIFILLIVTTTGIGVDLAGQSNASSPTWASRDLRAGIIGTDTSHVPQFTTMFNKTRPDWRIKIVAAFKGGSADLPISATRVEGFAKTIQEQHGVEIVDTIDALLTKVDVVLLESVDGRPHLAQVTPVFKAHKRVFIDKPLAATLEDVRRIVQLSKETGTPFFSSSSYRFYDDVVRLRRDASVGKVLSVQASSPFNKIPFHPDLFYYGIHGIEALYAFMGTGCVSVTRKVEGGADVTTCTWKDGRVGSYFGPLSENSATSGAKQPALKVTGDRGTADAAGQGYEGLEAAIAQFFHTGKPPFDVAETIEMFEFMTAAQISMERGGAQVSLASLRK